MTAISICGCCTGEAEFSHSSHGADFYKVTVAVERLSGTKDFIPVIIPPGAEIGVKIEENSSVFVIGEIRTRNESGEDGKRHLSVYVLAREIGVGIEVGENDCTLEGFLCKPPKFRKTPLRRAITETVVAVNRPFGKSDYIPCICWGANAVYCADLEVGAHIKIKGRFQSREYRKEISPLEFGTRITYEVSVRELEEVGDESH